MQQQHDGRILRSGLAGEDFDTVAGPAPLVGDRIGRSPAIAAGLGSRGALRPRTGSSQSGNAEQKQAAIHGGRRVRKLSNFHLNLHVKIMHGVADDPVRDQTPS